SCLADEFPADGVQVSAVVVPYTVSPRTVTWGLESGSQSVEVVPIGAEAVVTRDGSKTGDGIITATPNAGGNAGTFKFYLHDESAIVTPTFVNITGPSPMPTSLDEGDTVNYTAEVGPVGAPQDVTWEVFAEDGTSATTAATIDSDGILTAGTTAEDTVVKVVATAADTSVKSTAVSITIKKSTGEISRNWTFGPGTLVPWEDIDSGTPNTETLSLAGGLTLIPPTGGARWYSGRVQSNMGYTGTYQPGAAGVFGEIDDFGVPVKVTIIWTHTGDTAPNPDRNMYIKFGEDPQIDNPIGASGNLASAATFETATFSATGQGKVEFGATGSLRIYEIKVESVGEDEGPYYLWEAATSESFSLGSSPASRVVNGKTWTRMSGTFTVNTSGIAFPSSGGGRLVIGSASTDATTSTTTDPAGEFDFSKAKRLTISYNGFDGGGNFQVYVNNNTTGQANSVLGGASRIYSATALTGDDIVLTINPSAFGNDASLANAFIYLRTESAVSAMNITKILIEDM
ncbi:MAG: hypothetical protein FWH38_03185, partial [Treponema sp.]|nr:hypothetical protein [Treponema sp.]